MARHGLSAYRSKEDLLSESIAGRSIVHLGAVGNTCASTERKAELAADSVHAYLTRVADRCVGVDLDEAAVDAITERGTFDNLIVADATKLRRDDIPLERIDAVVAGDIIEHLVNPGLMLAGIAQWADPHTELIVTTPNAVGLPLIARYGRGRQVDGQDHVLSFNIYTLCRLLERHGWQTVTAATCYQEHARRSRLFTVGRLALERAPQFGGTLFVRTVQAPA